MYKNANIKIQNTKLMQKQNANDMIRFVLKIR